MDEFFRSLTRRMMWSSSIAMVAPLPARNWTPSLPLEHRHVQSCCVPQFRCQAHDVARNPCSARRSPSNSDF